MAISNRRLESETAGRMTDLTVYDGSVINCSQVSRAVYTPYRPSGDVPQPDNVTPMSLRRISELSVSYVSDDEDRDVLPWSTAGVCFTDGSI